MHCSNCQGYLRLQLIQHNKISHPTEVEEEAVEEEKDKQEKTAETISRSTNYSLLHDSYFDSSSKNVASYMYHDAI